MSRLLAGRFRDLCRAGHPDRLLTGMAATICADGVPGFAWPALQVDGNVSRGVEGGKKVAALFFYYQSLVCVAFSRLLGAAFAHSAKTCGGAAGCADRTSWLIWVDIVRRVLLGLPGGLTVHDIIGWDCGDCHSDR